MTGKKPKQRKSTFNYTSEADRRREERLARGRTSLREGKRWAAQHFGTGKAGVKKSAWHKSNRRK